AILDGVHFNVLIGLLTKLDEYKIQTEMQVTTDKSITLTKSISSSRGPKAHKRV
ncbi:unnamed protein product, partial [Dovyalis caffra]